MPERRGDAPRRHRVFLGTIEIAGYYARLQRGLSAIGTHAEACFFEPHPFGYEGDAARGLHALIRHASSRRSRSTGLVRASWLVVRTVLATLLLGQAIARFDTFVFGFGSSLLPWNLDLPILRLFRKRIIVNMAHGSELRPPYIDGALQTADGEPLGGAAFIHRRCGIVASRMRRIERWADYIIGAPFSSTQFARRRLVNHFAIGVPVEPIPAPEGPATPASPRVRILHSPSHPAVKGSGRIRDVVDDLRRRGHAIDYVEISGRSNDEVLDEIACCDFVIDQIYSDTPMAGFAAEAACFAKPAVVGGYRLDELAEHLPGGGFPPTALCHPDDLGAQVHRLIVDRDHRLALGASAQRFVRTHWAAVAVAERYVALMEDRVPDSWWLEPKSVNYVEGCGQPTARSRQIIRDLVEQHGVAALRLSHRPELERAFLVFADLADA
jgi:hypothetical protein